MKSSKDLLGSVLKTSQMGQIGISTVMHYPISVELKNALRSQIREYRRIESAARMLAYSRGWKLEELNAMLPAMAKLEVRTKLMCRNKESQIAQMVIKGNTMGMIKSLQNLHHSSIDDQPILDLSEKLLQKETENIYQMQGFL